MSALMPREIASATYAFGRNLSYASLPAEVRCQAARCLVDLLGVAAAGSGTVMARIARSVALSQFGALPGQGARTFFSGGTVSAAGAAMANSNGDTRQSTADDTRTLGGCNTCAGNARVIF